LEKEVESFSVEEKMEHSGDMEKGESGDDTEISDSDEEKKIRDEDEEVSDVASVEKEEGVEDYSAEEEITRNSDNDSIEVETIAVAEPFGSNNDRKEEMEEEGSAESDEKPMEDPADMGESEEECLVVDAVQKNHASPEEEQKEDAIDIEEKDNALELETSEEGWRFLISRGKYPPTGGNIFLELEPFFHLTNR